MHRIVFVSRHCYPSPFAQLLSPPFDFKCPDSQWEIHVDRLAVKSKQNRMVERYT
jgi:hypothetical protein